MIRLKRALILIKMREDSIKLEQNSIERAPSSSDAGQSKDKSQPPSIDEYP